MLCLALVVNVNGLKASWLERPSHSTSHSQVRLSVRPYYDPIGRGQPCILQLTVRNRTKETLYLSDTYPERDYRFEVRDSRGRALALTKEGEHLANNLAVFKHVSLELKPGAAHSDTLVLSKLYDLSAPDTYAIWVTRAVYGSDSELFANAGSKVVRITVTK